MRYTFIKSDGSQRWFTVAWDENNTAPIAREVLEELLTELAYVRDETLQVAE